MKTTPQPTAPLRIVIIGGGVAGALVAAQLLPLAPDGTIITVIERGSPIGRGVAYNTHSRSHLLNVPVERMGAHPDDPGHFLRWVRERLGRPGCPDAVSPGDFLPRHLYGEYIAYVLLEARQAASPAVAFAVRTGEAVDVAEREGADGARVVLADGTELAADRVVLAIGNLPGEYPVRSGRQVYRSRRYVHTPWAPDAVAGIGPDADVVIAGQGLTASDITLELVAQGHRGRIVCISRRGLRHKAHAPGPGHHDFLKDEPAPHTLLALLRRVRAEVRAAAARGIPWTDVVDALRPHSHRLWQALDWTERARFLRHLRPYWEIHRHRLAPQIDAQLSALAAQGRLEFIAARFIHVEETAGGLAVTIHRRRAPADETLFVAKFINCTGPRSDYSKYQHPLLINLLARGLIDHDPLALGAAALPTGQLLRHRNGPIPWLYTLGSPLKGVLWESTAVPEIRAQARVIARELLGPVTASPQDPS